jgi:hypothetical protein
MALPEISKEKNFKISMRKYLYTNANLYSPPISLLFDTGMEVPINEDSPSPSWMTINFGTFIVGTLNEAMVDIYCCARNDTSSDVVSDLRDLLVEWFTDSSQFDSARRIPIYINLNTAEEEIVGWMVASIAYQSPLMLATDGTKYKLVTIQLKWSSQY